MPLDLRQVWEGGSRDDREPGDRPLTGDQLVRRWVDGRGVMGLLNYAAGLAAIAALACCNSAARAQSNSRSAPAGGGQSDRVAEAGPPHSSRSRSPRGGPDTAGRKRPHLSSPTADGGGGYSRQGARAHQPHFLGNGGPGRREAGPGGESRQDERAPRRILTHRCREFRVCACDRRCGLIGFAHDTN